MAPKRVDPLSQEDALSEMRQALTMADVGDRRKLLHGFVDRIEADKKQASVYYTFPLFARRGLYSMPPGGFDIKVPLFCDEIQLR